MKEFHKIINDICIKNNIKFSIFSDDWIVRLEKGSDVRFIIGYKFDINRSAVTNLFDDKYGLFSILKDKNISVADHIILFRGYDRDAVLKYFNDNNKYLVIKDNMGSCGTGVFKSNKIDEVYELIDKILLTSYSVSVCPYYDISTEYRLITLNGEIKLIYGKKKPVVIGDGKSRKIDLLRKFNPHYFSKIDRPDLEEVLKKGEIFEYNWQFNLSRGSIPFVIEDEKTIDKLKKLCHEVLDVVDINFCSVDIIELTSKEMMVLECNSGVMMENFIKYMEDGYDIAHKIYEEVVLDMFK